MSDVAGDLHQIHGLSSLDRSGREGLDASQEVIIRDRKGLVHIELSNPGYGAALSPVAARYLAHTLLDAADRVERAARS